MKVAISGYYGYNNAGDELILDSIIKTFLAEHPDTSVTVFSNNPKQTKHALKVNAVNRWNPLSVLKTIMACDVFLLGGGGLFQDKTSSLSLYYYLANIVAAKVVKKRVLVHAVSINELKSLNRIITAKILMLAESITVREKGSYNTLINWNVPASMLAIVPDAVLFKKGISPKEFSNKPKVAFVLRPYEGFGNTVKSFAAMADALAEKFSATIVFVPFYPDQDAGFECSVIAAMSAKAELLEWDTPNDVFELFSRVDFVVSQRLHGLIMAVLYGLPFIGISNDTKLSWFLNEVGLENAVKLRDIKDELLIDKFVDRWESRDAFRKKLLIYKSKALAVPPIKLNGIF